MGEGGEDGGGTVMTAMTMMMTTTMLRSKGYHRWRGQQALTFVASRNNNAAGDNNLHIDGWQECHD
jgi:hypothetical protein